MKTLRDIMRCVVCGSESVEGGRYCPGCGAILAEPIRSDDPRLVEAKDDLRKTIMSRQSTDIIVEPLWAIVPLVLTFVGAIAGLAIILDRFQPVNGPSNWTTPDVFSTMRDFFLVMIVFEVSSVAILAFITHKLVKRRNGHFLRDQNMRMALVKLVRAAAWSRERSDSVFPELAIMEQDPGREPDRDPMAWSLAIALGAVGIIAISAIFVVSHPDAWTSVIVLAFVLSALVSLAAFILMIYMFYWLGKEVKEHDTRWNIIMFNVRNAMSKLGFPSPTTTRYGNTQLPEREFGLYLLLTLVFSPFVYYWWYALIKDPNDHFRAQWAFEDDLLAAIADRRYPSSPSISMASTR